MMTADNPVILFDGVCNLCNSSVQFVLRRDKKKQFLFGSLQGRYGQQVLNELNMPADDLHSFILKENNAVYTKSTAALRVLKILGGGWKFLYIFIIVPRFIRDGVYGFIARNRYRWFGKKEACWVPTPELKSRFIE
jgi:predicted DCC family thiol-disulfide oxidoreductase YuxK